MKQWFEKFNISDRKFMGLFLAGILGPGVKAGINEGGVNGIIIIGTVLIVAFVIAIKEEVLYEGKRSLPSFKKAHLNNNKFTKYLIPKPWIPKNKKEEIQGDLYELKASMIQDGLPMWRIKLILKYHITRICLSFLKIRFLDYALGRKEVDKDI